MLTASVLAPPERAALVSGMHYFAYGSNMSLARLQARVPSAGKMGSCVLRGHVLRFHKQGKDGSGKCDAFATGNGDDYLIGVLFRIDSRQKARLDAIEGLGYGYEEKWVSLRHQSGTEYQAATYYATRIDSALKPYSWYKNHVLVGAREATLPEDYIGGIEAVEHIEDPDSMRDEIERAVHSTWRTCNPGRGRLG